MNIGNINQKNSMNAMAMPASSGMSLEDQMRTAKMTATGSVSSKSDEIGIPQDEEFARRWDLFSKTVLDGTVRSPTELRRLVKEFTENDGEPYFKTCREQIFALRQAIMNMPDEQISESDNATIKKSLVDASYGLFTLLQMNQKTIDKWLNPSIQNGGLDMQGHANMWEKLEADA